MTLSAYSYIELNVCKIAGCQATSFAPEPAVAQVICTNDQSEVTLTLICAVVISF
jgi:hypothetical protein